MNRFFAILFIIALTTVFYTPVNAQDKPIEARIDSLMTLMTLEEKVGQMNQYNGFWDVTGPVPKEGNAKMKYDHLRKGLVGSMLNVKGAENTRKMQEIVVNESRLGIPLVFGFDVIHGHKTLSPVPLAEAASWDLDAIEKSARIAATEASALGIHWTFAPMIDISRDARWGRVMEGGGEDPYLGAMIGVARIKGFQGDDLTEANTIIACAKHFAGYGFAESGKDYNTVDVGTSTLYNVILPPFKAAIENDVRTVMNSFNVLNGIPATANEFLQRDILKGKWGFDGFVISDWGSGFEMIDHGFSEDLMDVAVQSANAGSDMDMESYAYVTHLVQAVKDGKVSMDKIDDAVRRILRVKFELGLFDDPYRYCSKEREKDLIYHPEHLKGALDMAKKSIVLLKNESDLLPLSKTDSDVALIGPLAADKNSPLGGWRIGSDDNSAVSILEGVQQYIKDVKHAKGPDLVIGTTSFINEVEVNETDRSGFDEAVALAKEVKTVVMVLGEHGFQSGEGRSRADLGLPGLQQELLEAVYAVNPNIVLVLTSGRPLTIPWAADNVPAIIAAWQLGTQTGNAVAQVLFGDYNPSGKLPMTFPRSVGQVPIYYNHYNTGRPGPKELVFWSHYTDESNDPQYPFGYGLSYTRFEYSDLKVDASNSEAVKVSVTVKNSGKRAGEEVVQLYIRDRVASVVRPVKELKGFDKISLEAGTSRNVSFTLTKDHLGFYNNDGEFIFESGSFDIMVGTSSAEGLTTRVEIK